MEDIRTYPRGFFQNLKYLFKFYVGKPPLNLKVESMQFYEKGYGSLPRESRMYTSSFPQQTTRYVSCDIYVRVVRWQPSRMYRLSYSTYRPDGSLQHKSFVNLQIDSHTYGVLQTLGGWGWREPGNWPKGRYQAQVLIDGLEVATDHFTIEPPPPPKPPDEVLQQPRVRFYASRREAHSIRFPKQTTREVICELTVRNLLYQQEYRYYTVTVQWYTDDGRLLWEEKRTWCITSQEQEPLISWSLQTSGWSQGIYRVEILIDGKGFAWGVFAIE